MTEPYDPPPENTSSFHPEIDYSDRSHGRNQAEAIGTRSTIYDHEDVPRDPFIEEHALGLALYQDTEERCLYLLDHNLIHTRRNLDLLRSIQAFLAENNGTWDEFKFISRRHYPESWKPSQIPALKEAHSEEVGSGNIATGATWEPTLEELRDVTRRRGFHQLANQIHVYSRSPRNVESFDALAKVFTEIEALEMAYHKPDQSLIQCGAAFCNKKIEKAPVLIEGLLKQGSKMVLGGGSKSFKTWTLLSLGLSVAYGIPFWEHEIEQGRVLYVDMELDEEDLQYRANWIMRAMGIERPIPGKFDVLPLRKQLNQWRRKSRSTGRKIDPFDEITKIITKSRNKYALIVLDPLYKFLGDRNENDAGDMADLFADIDLLSTDTGAGIVLGVHFSKGNQALKEAIDRISGSGVFARDPDSILTMTPLDEKQGEFTYQVEVRLRKFKPLRKFAVRWEEPLMVRDDTLDPDDLKGKAGRKAEYSSNDLKSLLPGDGSGMKRDDWKSLAAEKIGIKPTRFSDLVNELLQNGEIEKKQVGRYVMYSVVNL